MRNRGRLKNKRSRFTDPNDGGYIASGIVILIILTISIAGGLFYYNAYKDKNEIDNNYCRNTKDSAITVILIDHTDKLNPVQQASIEKKLWDAAKSVPKNSLLKVYSVGRTEKQTLVPILEKCNPGDKDTVSDLTGNKKKAAERYENEFRAPIMNLLKGVVSDTTDSVSPIMESLQSISVTSFIGENESPKKLIIVSDFLQNSKGFSVYKGIPNFDSFVKSPYWQSIKADFQNVDVHLYVITRHNGYSLQNAQLMQLWEGYFTEQNARIRHIYQIEG